ncbi:MAG: phosphotransferase [Odoribacteraceae bacterium]|jgi:aminoglycoside/choline kinase family phosphotransferase|nr:phosphotransferase [Odoribacteraceae bacterium]
MLETITRLLQAYAGHAPAGVEALPASGSARRYFRLTTGEGSVVATWHEDARENRAFAYFSNHFRARGLRVPLVYAMTSDGKAYLQQDLGRVTLLDVVEREGTALSGRTMTLYRQALEELTRFQVEGHEGMDYGQCLSRPDFDGTRALWDLNYYKYCFLRLSGVAFDEERLEADFKRLAARVEGERRDCFMYRDFQSRNIMVRGESLYFIDYQGGGRGAPPYDAASLLHDALVPVPGEQREELLEHYLSLLVRSRPAAARGFRVVYDHFALARLLQALGAFGLRGLHEGKRLFLESIRPGLAAVVALFDDGRLGTGYPEIERGARAAARLYDGIEI